MTSSRDLWRDLWRVLRRDPVGGLRRVGLPLALAATAALAACGGGTSQVRAFTPSRVLVFGDETSVIVNDGSADGFRYTINDRTSTAAGKCLASPTFAQMMVSGYGMVVEQCNPTGATPKAFILAVAGATVDDVSSGLQQQVARVSGGVNDQDMALVMIGANDVIALYEDVRAGRMTNAEAVSEAQRRGRHAGEGVNAILSTGARAIVVTIPDMSLSPYAVTQQTGDPGAKTLLATLSYEFNAYLRTSIDSQAYDGRNYGLVLADDIVSAMAKFPTSYLTSPSVAAVAACTTASAVDCLTTTLVEGAGTLTHLWADDRHLGPNAHNRIGLAVQSRMLGNPF